jgi:hypothetical protein
VRAGLYSAPLKDITMSAPNPISLQNPWYSFTTEMMSGMSALNMEPNPIPVDELDEYDRFLSETDKWVKHAVEHFEVAIQATEMIRDREKALASRNEVLEKELKELKVRFACLTNDYENEHQELVELQDEMSSNNYGQR